MILHKGIEISKQLVIIIVLMLLPFIISYNIINDKTSLMPLLTAAFIGQSILIMSSLYKYYGGFKQKALKVALLLVILQMFTLITNYLLSIDTNIKDYINIVARGLNVYLFCAAIWNASVEETEIIKVLKYILFFIAIACIYNIIANYATILNLRYITSSYQSGIKSFFVNRNQYGALLFIGVVVGHYYVAYNNATKSNISLIILFMINMFLTMSRGAILAVIVFYAYMYIKNIKNTKVHLLVIMSILATLFYLYTNQRAFFFIEKFIMRMDSGFAGRGEIWSMGINVFMTNIVNGIGYHTGIELAKSIGLGFDQFHNIFIDAMVTGGIIEVIIIIIFFYKMIKKVKKHVLNKRVCDVYNASIVAFFTLGLFESVSVFSIGYVDTICTIAFVTLPIMIINVNKQ